MLAFFTQHNYFQIHTCFCIYLWTVHFFPLLNRILLYGDATIFLSTYLLMDTYFQFYTITNIAAVNIICKFLSQYMLLFLLTTYQGMELLAIQQCMNILVFLHPCQHMDGQSSILDIRVGVASYYGLICFSLMTVLKLFSYVYLPFIYPL